MAKKRNKQKQAQTNLSEAAYMRSGRARKLPIHECLINKEWEDSGIASIVVSRKHVNGNFSFASFLVDLYCLGVKDAWYRSNILPFEYQQFLERLSENFEITQTDYAKVHNIIYGAVAFAADYGFSPVHEFGLAKMMLEEDTEEIPLIEYAFGVQGKPHLVVNSDNPKLPFYLSKLEKHAGKGNYDLVFLDDFDSEEEDYDLSDEDEEIEYTDLDTYSSEDWETFILETDPESLILTRAESFYIFEKAIASHTLEDPGFDVRNISISSEPMANEQSEEETTEAQEIYTSLFLEENSAKAVDKLLQRIKDNIERFPQNPVFHNYLINAYAQLGQVKKHREATLSVVREFPDYLFGKLAYAQMLIQEGQVKEVPGVFHNQLFLKSAFPGREVFHISELISFNTIMCLYFMEQNELHTAYAYRKMLADMEIPDHMLGSEELFFQIDIGAIKEVTKLVEAAKLDKKKRRELIATLVSRKD